MARNDDFEIDEDDDGNKTVTLPADQAINQRNLARDAEANKNAAAERDAAKRELAFIKAGIDTESPVGKLFARGFDGEITVDAIKTAAAEIPGLIADAAPAANAEPTPEEAETARLEAEQTSQRQQLSSGNSNAGTVPSPDPRDVARETFEAAKQRGMSNEKSMVAGFDVLVAAAATGDDRVVIPAPWENR